MPDASNHPTYPTAIAIAAYGAWVRGDIGTAIDLAHRSLEAGSTRPSPSGLPERVLTNAHFYLGHIEQFSKWLDAMVESATTHLDAARTAHVLYMRSIGLTSMGANDDGATVARQVDTAARRVGSPTAAAQADYALGLALEATDPPLALIHLERAASTAAAAGNRWIEAFALTEVYWLRARQGEVMAGLSGFAEVITTWYRGGDWANQWLSLRHVFGIWADLGSAEEAAVLHGALLASDTAHALPFEPADAEHLDDHVDGLRTLLGGDRFDGAVNRGASMSNNEIVEFVIEHIRDVTAADPTVGPVTSTAGI
jgi:hypothetical protein